MAESVIAPGAALPASEPSGQRIVGFWGRRGSLFAILLKNSLLGLVTLGVYRFWARTRLRQFFWNSIAIDGEPLEYVGRGMELFVGFLIVIAVLIPLSTGYSLLSVFLETTAPDVSDAVNFIYLLTLAWLGQYAFFRARRYRLARTVWRGIRAGQDGSAAGYAWLWFGYAVLSVITLGWAVPWMTVELQRYEVEKARYGVENFRYEGAGIHLLRRWFPCAALWTLGVAIAVTATVTNWFEVQAIVQSATEIGDGRYHIGQAGSERLASMFGLSVVAFAVSIPFIVYYRIGAFRYMFGAASLSDIQFTAEFSGWRLVGYWFLYIGVVAVALLILGIFMFGGIGGAAVMSEAGGAPEERLAGAGAFLVFIPFLLLFFLMPILNFLLFYYPAIRHIATTLKLTDISNLERIVQSSKDDPRFGEGLASALDFDVGGF